MQLADSALADALLSETSPLPPRVTPALLRSLAESATLAGGPHETMTVRAPFTDRAVAEVWIGGPEDVRHAVQRARKAQAAWASRPASERAAVLRRFHNRIHEHLQTALDLAQLETGKARLDALIEALDVAMVARYYGYHGAEALAPQRRRGLFPFLTPVAVHHHAKGVVGIIAPWNYPLSMAITDALPALLAGNAVVLKPAEQTPFTALWLARQLYEAGLPPEVLHVVPGRGEDLGDALIEAVDFVQFTGSTAVGRLVGERAGRALTGVSLELGGKNPLIVREDCDLERAMPGLVQACFSNTGQLCISAERLFVHESRFDEFLSRFSAAAEALHLGASFDFSAHVGSLASQDQLDKVQAHVEDARSKGATVVCGGRALPEIGPFFYAPTILTGVRPDMLVYEQETFGPVVAVYAVGDDAEAVARANDSAYGLHASVWSRDLAAGERVATQLRTGSVTINDAFASSWAATAAPMGGVGASGLGRRHGAEGLLKFTESQTVAVSVLGPLAPGSFGLSVRDFANGMTRAGRLLAKIPGLR